MNTRCLISIRNPLIPAAPAAPAARGWASAVALAAALMLGGCASGPGQSPAGSATGASTSIASTSVANTSAPAVNPVDPWERWNRQVYAFNDTVDTALVRPVAKSYEAVLPALVRSGIGNALGNIRDVWSAANQVLQGKVQFGLEMGLRVAVNSTIGLGGLLDPATEMGLVKRPEDFGQTLGRWGLPSGPFVMLPLVGPSTVRDTAGFLLDRRTAPAALPPSASGQYGVLAVELVDGRARLLSAGRLLDQVALDRYSFLRDGYLAQRRDALYDGAPPLETFDDDPGADAPAQPAARPPAAGPVSVKPGPPPAAPASAAMPSK